MLGLVGVMVRDWIFAFAFLCFRSHENDTELGSGEVTDGDVV